MLWINNFKPVLAPVVVLTVAMGLLVFVLVPSYNAIQDGRNQVEASNQRIERLTRKITVLNTLEEAKLKGLLQLAANAVPSDKNVPGLLSGLERAAQSASASIEGFSISPGKVGTPSAEATGSAGVALAKEKSLDQGVRGLPFKATLRGGYQALHDFLSSLSKSNRLVNVDSVVFSTGKSSGADVVSNLELFLYYQPESLDLGPADAALEELSLSEIRTIEQVSSYPVFTSAPPLVPVGKSNPFAR